MFNILHKCFFRYDLFGARIAWKSATIGTVRTRFHSRPGVEVAPHQHTLLSGAEFCRTFIRTTKIKKFKMVNIKLVFLFIFEFFAPHRCDFDSRFRQHPHVPIPVLLQHWCNCRFSIYFEYRTKEKILFLDYNL